jgi:hypothetical protein
MTFIAEHLAVTRKEVRGDARGEKGTADYVAVILLNSLA